VPDANGGGGHACRGGARGQWGDEGKGKATDQLGASTDYVVKFNGGNNAGHTVVVGDEKYALHLLPSGILTRGVTPIIGNGVVVDLEVLFHELANLSARGVDVSRLRISANAHVIPSYNRTMDRVVERFLGKRQIGTTGRGIGPTYADKMNRVGIRIQDLFDASILRQKVEGALLQKNALLVKVYNRREADVEAVTAELLSYADRVRPMLIDCSLELNNALDAGKTVVFEAGQATMLDVDHGTYPFVTSSSCTAGGACTGSGVGPTRLDRSSAWPRLHHPRRRGPLPHRAVRRGRRPNPGGRRRVRDHHGAAAPLRLVRRRRRPLRLPHQRVDRPGHHQAGRPHRVRAHPGVRGVRGGRRAARRDAVRPVRHPPRDPGLRVPRRLDEDISRARTFEELPVNAQRYLEYLEAVSGCRISSVGVGPEREQTIVRVAAALTECGRGHSELGLPLGLLSRDPAHRIGEDG
jgi:adenylosuccinate synthase